MFVTLWKTQDWGSKRGEYWAPPLPWNGEFEEKSCWRYKLRNMLKIMYEFLRILHRLLTKIGEDQGSFLVFWEVNLFLEKKAAGSNSIWTPSLVAVSPKTFWNNKKMWMSSHLFLLRRDPAPFVSPTNSQNSQVHKSTVFGCPWRWYPQPGWRSRKQCVMNCTRTRT